VLRRRVRTNDQTGCGLADAHRAFLFRCAVAKSARTATGRPLRTPTAARKPSLRRLHRRPRSRRINPIRASRRAWEHTWWAAQLMPISATGPLRTPFAAALPACAPVPLTGSAPA